MQLLSSLFLLSASLGLSSAVALPSGAWETTTLPNGNLQLRPLSGRGETITLDPGLIKRSPSSDSASTLSPRADQAGCLNYPGPSHILPTADTDAAVTLMRQILGPNGKHMNGPSSSSTRPFTLYTWVSGSVAVYACINLRQNNDSYSVTFTQADADRALRTMDAKCARYQPSWFRFDTPRHFDGFGKVWNDAASASTDSLGGVVCNGGFAIVA